MPRLQVTRILCMGLLGALAACTAAAPEPDDGPALPSALNGGAEVADGPRSLVRVIGPGAVRCTGVFVAPHAFLVASACASPAVPSPEVPSLAIYPHQFGRTGTFKLEPRQPRIHAIGGAGPTAISLVVLEAPLLGTTPAELPASPPADGSEVAFYDFGHDAQRAVPHRPEGDLQLVIGRWGYPSSVVSRFDRGAAIMQGKTVVGFLMRGASTAAVDGPPKTTAGTDLVVSLAGPGEGGVDLAARVRAILATEAPGSHR